MERIGNKVSYIKKPLSRFSIVAAALCAVSVGLTCTTVAAACMTRGNVPLAAAALGLSGIIAAVVSVVYGALSFSEKEKNYVLAKISLVGSGLILLIWIMILVIALR